LSRKAIPVVVAANRAPIPFLEERRTIADLIAGTKAGAQRTLAPDAPALAVSRLLKRSAFLFGHARPLVRSISARQ
jgi:hypothetical protein